MTKRTFATWIPIIFPLADCRLQVAFPGSLLLPRQFLPFSLVWTLIPPTWRILVSWLRHTILLGFSVYQCKFVYCTYSNTYSCMWYAYVSIHTNAQTNKLRDVCTCAWVALTQFINRRKKWRIYFHTEIRKYKSYFFLIQFLTTIIHNDNLWWSCEYPWKSWKEILTRSVQEILCKSLISLPHPWTRELLIRCCGRI